MKEKKDEANIEWQLPKDLEEKELMTFPIECFPTTLRNYTLELAEELQVSVDMVASAILGILSVCNQKKYNVEGKAGWIEPINLYILVIAPPAERKSPLYNKITKPLYDYEDVINAKLKPLIISSKNQKDIIQDRISSIKVKLKKNAKGISKEDLLKDLEKSELELLNFQEIKKVQLIADDITPEAIVNTMKDNEGKLSIFSSEGRNICYFKWKI
ncbi:MAG: DUF3987 domain-containing protein [Clostridia bacterium]|nr:DUF3987 domain-containing protein [Clostridia bacterium]